MYNRRSRELNSVFVDVSNLELNILINLITTAHVLL
jgi:hypothetical protein